MHDFLLDLRGAERVFLAMCEIWPDADVFTAVYDAKGTEGRFEARRRDPQAYVTAQVEFLVSLGASREEAGGAGAIFEKSSPSVSRAATCHPTMVTT